MNSGRWRPTIGLALGGGAARGLAHVGVLQALERAEIRPDIIVGTSIGSIVGGAYAAIGDAQKLHRRVHDVVSTPEFQKNRLNFLKESKENRNRFFLSVSNLVRKGIFFGVANMRASFLSAEVFAESIAAILPEEPIEGLDRRFAAVALDLDRAEEVLICSGDLRQAANASSAIPGVLPPVQIGERVLIDGGWIDKVPVLAAFNSAPTWSSRSTFRRRSPKSKATTEAPKSCCGPIRSETTRSCVFRAGWPTC